ncbi:hypothetical protein BD26P3_00027 [Phocaeicola phage BD26P3]|nr:hypothetical protein BD26P1_00010 [Phocaeicola phage BD26P1]WAX06091.1 hypothetical protein BD26P2_00044 [Phocaeicola phage BD26P2]WAX06123.1 hypothetical protein BD26P3_00027 [Phocaeicola phage BD26P3]WAX06188.1 hypothetical protein BD26P4_00044 [Phocaeicola phage BD26P4]WAX06220.1 hypothetical protein BD26P5_00027 [Phocaeicola phage BD26P5]
MRKMNVLSLFDGMSGGQIALTELDIPINKYYASEIDKYAMKFTMQNFPDTIQVGDIRELDINKLDKIDLLIGGSPCTNLSMAGKRKGLSTKEGVEIFDLETYLELKENGFEFEGQSYLFWEYIRIYNELLERGDKPKFFLENVEMGKKWEGVFNDILGRKGIHINSALVSAQNRRRIYWTDIHDDIPQPEDRGILLRDILEKEVDEKYFLSDEMIEGLKGRVKTENIADITIQDKYIKKNIRSIDGKAHTLLATSHKGARANGMTLVDYGNFRIRRLTPTECARLQTVPDWCKWDGISDTQRYRMLGNGWNIETIKHIFKGMGK